MGKGVYAHHIEYKTTTMTLLASSSSLVYLCRMLATSLTATCSRSPVKWFVALGPWVCVLLLSVGAGGVVVHGRWSFDGRCRWFSWLLGGWCCSLGANHGLPLAVCSACGCRLGGCHLLGSWVCLWWGLHDVAAGNVDSALGVVDAGDMGL